MTKETLDRANKIISEIESYKRILITLGECEEIEIIGKKKKSGVSDSFRVLRIDKTKSESKYCQDMDTFILACKCTVKETIESRERELESL